MVDTTRAGWLAEKEDNVQYQREARAEYHEAAARLTRAAGG